MTAQAMQEYVKIQLAKYQREVVVNITFANVLSASTDFTSDFDGYLGIQPWGAKMQPGGNFMW